MVVRIHNTGKWAVLKAGEILQLPGQHRRKIRVEVNCVAPTRLDLVEGDKTTFLAVVQGLEVLEFVAGAEVHLVPTSDDEVWYFTNDGDQIAVDKPNAVSFTTIESRRARNPELEMMMFRAEQNINRRLAHLQAEQDAWRAEREAAQPHDPETGEVIEDAENSAAAGGGSAGAAAAEPGQSEPAAAGQGAPVGAGKAVPGGNATAA